MDELTQTQDWGDVGTLLYILQPNLPWSSLNPSKKTGKWRTEETGDKIDTSISSDFFQRNKHYQKH